MPVHKLLCLTRPLYVYINANKPKIVVNENDPVNKDLY